MDPTEYEGGVNMLRYTNNNSLFLVDPEGLDEIEGSGNCKILSVPIRFELPSATLFRSFLLTIKSGLKVVGTGSRRVCKSCCSDGRQVEDISFRVQLGIFGRLEVTGGLDIDVPLLSGRALKGYAGIRGEIGGEGRILGNVQTNKCNGVNDYETIVCGQFRSRGTIRAGFSIRLTMPNRRGYDVATGEGFLQGGASYKLCFKISTDGYVKYHTHEFGKIEGTYGYRVCFLGTCHTRSFSLF
jgi:hypothetical protein